MDPYVSSRSNKVQNHSNVYGKEKPLETSHISVFE